MTKKALRVGMTVWGFSSSADEHKYFLAKGKITSTADIGGYVGIAKYFAGIGMREIYFNPKDIYLTLPALLRAIERRMK